MTLMKTPKEQSLIIKDTKESYVPSQGKQSGLQDLLKGQQTWATQVSGVRPLWGAAGGEKTCFLGLFRWLYFEDEIQTMSTLLDLTVWAKTIGEMQYLQ